MKLLQIFFSSIRQLIGFLHVEFWIALIINLIVMGLTYALKGVKGVENLISSLNDQYDGVSISATIIVSSIGVILWIFYYFFNSKYKQSFKEVSEGCIDSFISLFRLAGGILLAFTTLYLLEEGFAPILIAFIYYGLLSIFNSSVLVFVKKKMYSKPNRELKQFAQ